MVGVPGYWIYWATKSRIFIDVNGSTTGSTSIVIPYQGSELTKTVLFSVDMTEWLDEEGSTGLNVFSVSHGDQMQVRGDLMLGVVRIPLIVL